MVNKTDIINSNINKDRVSDWRFPVLFSFQSSGKLGQFLTIESMSCIEINELIYKRIDNWNEWRRHILRFDLLSKWWVYLIRLPVGTVIC